MSDDIYVDRTLTIPGDEITFTFTTSGGPGGQHANRSSTRAVAAWNVESSKILNGRQRQRIRSALRRRVDSSGTLRVASDRHRSQLRNRRDAAARLGALVADALRPRRARVSTTPTAGAKERRLHSKRVRSQVKRNRRAPSADD